MVLVLRADSYLNGLGYGNETSARCQSEQCREKKTLWHHGCEDRLLGHPQAHMPQNSCSPGAALAGVEDQSAPQQFSEGEVLHDPDDPEYQEGLGFREFMCKVLGSRDHTFRSEGLNQGSGGAGRAM